MDQASEPRTDPLAFCREELESLEALGLRRHLRVLSSPQGPRARVDGRELLLFASNDYLGLAGHPTLKAAASEAMERYGLGAGAARLVVGGFEPHEELERRLAAFKGSEDCLLFSSGFLANATTIPALLREGDLVVSDALNHASIIDGVRLARAERCIVDHRDPAAIHAALARHRAERPEARRLVVTDSLFSMEADLAPLPELVMICEQESAMLMVDEAHATGVVGPGGRGAVAQFGLEGRVPILMGTLSKALGASGGFVCGSRELCEFLRHKARGFVFDTAMPPSLAAAALAALDMLESEPERAESLVVRTRDLASRLRGLGLEVLEPDGAILPVLFGEPRRAVAISRALLEQGLLVPAIRPPTVPGGTSRLRITLSAAHSDVDLDRLVEAMEACLQR